MTTVSTEEDVTNSSKRKHLAIAVEENADSENLKRRPPPRYDGPPYEGHLYPAVAAYAPSSLRGLEDGDSKLWCACGLSKRQPWCDGSHAGTGIKPLRWIVPAKKQSLYSLCNCKYTKSPPYCDGTHVNLPCDYLDRIANCITAHGQVSKLCSDCGWVPDF